MKTNITNEGLKIGTICGLLAILLMYGGWAVGIEIFTSIQFISAFVPYMIIIILVAGFQVRKQNGGYLTFQEGLKYSFLSYVIAALIIAIGTYVLYNLIDKELGQKSMDIALEKTRSMMEKFGANEEDIDKQIATAEKEGSKTTLKQILFGTALGLIWDFVKALLITLVIKKQPSLEEQLNAPQS